MAPLLIGLAAGAAGAFFMDPQQGRRRRALVRDKMKRGVREGREFRDAAAKDLRARAHGALAQLRAMSGRPVSDDVLVGRVRAKLGRHVSHRRAIHVSAADGIVVVTGDILASEHPRLVRVLRLVPGVQDVDDRLDVHTNAEGISSLQGGIRPAGERLELLQAHWAPGTRAVVGGAGVFLVFYGLVRGGFRGVGALAAGATLLARAKANRPLLNSGTEPELQPRSLAATA